MNWDAIGALAELLGAIGVIASLVYLAAQIRGNTRSSQAASYQALSENVQAMNRPVFVDPDTADFLQRALESDTPFEGTDHRRWMAYTSALFRHYDNVSHQHEMGVLRRSQFESVMAPAHYHMSSPRCRATWRQMRFMFDDPMRSYVDDLAARAEARGAPDAEPAP